MNTDGQTDDRGEPQERLRRGEPGPHEVRHLLAEGQGRELPNITSLFRAVAYAERVHTSDHYRNITGMGDAVTVSVTGFDSRITSKDLQIGIIGGDFEVN